MHYYRWLRKQRDPDYKPKLRRPIAERVAERIRKDDESGCWVWTGHLGRNGYGSIHIDRKPRYAHRVVWELHRGPIPNGLPLDHLCRFRPCVNPDHLEPVTPAENNRRAKLARASGLGMTPNEATKNAVDHVIRATPNLPKIQVDAIAREAIRVYAQSIMPAVSA
jgi:hypothetical protein